jgi:hypothetical protein
MRFFGGHDYYDGVASYGGYDDKLVFVRDSRDAIYPLNNPIKPITSLRFNAIEGKKKKIFRPGRKYGFVGFADITEFEFTPLNVIFCGKIYTGIKATKYSGYTELHKDLFFWNFDEFAMFVGKKGIILDNTEIRNKFDRIQTDIRFDVKDITGDGFDYLMDNNIVTGVMNEFIIHGKDINTDWTLNGSNLGDYQFYKVFDAYQAYQEIEMWMGGVLSNSGNPMVEIADIDRVHKHGFDLTYGFRTRKKN